MTRRRKVALGLAGAGLTAVAVLALEIAYAASRDYLPAESAPAGTASYPSPRAATTAAPLRVVMLGDSTAAGVGASATGTTVGGRLAGALAERLARRVDLSSAARSGARAGDLEAQVSAALTGGSPDVAVVLIGANDATHVTSPGDVGADVGAAVRRLAAADVSVVVGTCPDMGAARALPRPVRDLVAWHGRAIARTSARAATEGGAVVVDLAGLTGPAFRADPATLSVDRFHPSDLGYGLWSAALEPAVVAGATGG